MNEVEKAFSKNNILTSGLSETILNQGKPAIEKGLKELEDYMGNGEKIIIMFRKNNTSEIIVHILDTSKEFMIKGGEKFMFTAKQNEQGFPEALIKKISIHSVVRDIIKNGINALLKKIM